MLLEPSADQEFFRETTARFLDDRAPVEEIRRLRDDPHGFDPAYWRGGAELGWTSLLVDEAHGGGSISGRGLIDLTLVAHEFGRHAAPGPLVPANVVASALSTATLDDAGDTDRSALLDALVAGDSVAAWCFAEPPPRDGLAEVTLTIEAHGDELVLNGRKRPVEGALGASHLLVTGRSGDGLTQVIVPADAPGVRVEAMRTVDLTRRFAVVDFDGVRVARGAALGPIGGADSDVERQLQHALVLTNAEAIGAMQAAFDMTVAWAFDRYSFGRPLSSYQALKHRFADMKCWLEASHAIGDEAAAAVAAADPGAAELVSVAKAYIGQYGAELVHECVQLHGGIGVTFDHDVHLFVRRLTTDRALYGTPAQHLRRIADLGEHPGEDAA